MSWLFKNKENKISDYYYKKLDETNKELIKIKKCIDEIEENIKNIKDQISSLTWLVLQNKTRININELTKKQ